MKVCAPDIALKNRHKTTRKWPIRGAPRSSSMCDIDLIGMKQNWSSISEGPCWGGVPYGTVWANYRFGCTGSVIFLIAICDWLQEHFPRHNSMTS